MGNTSIFKTPDQQPIIELQTFNENGKTHTLNILQLDISSKLYTIAASYITFLVKHCFYLVTVSH